MIIQKGVLKPGNFLILGSTYTKVKEFKDDKGNLLQIGIPGDAVEIIGLSAVPKAGEVVYEVKDEKKAKFILNKKKEKEL
jgi:translation initiation factor IF-2